MNQLLVLVGLSVLVLFIVGCNQESIAGEAIKAQKNVPKVTSLNKPDLIVESVIPEKITKFYVDFRVIVKNIGADINTPFKVKCATLNNDQENDQLSSLANPLSKGAVESVLCEGIEYPYETYNQDGIINYKITLDPENKVAESFEKNNVYLGQYVAKNDLVISQMGLYKGIVNNSPEFYVILKNIGTENIKNQFYVKFIPEFATSSEAIGLPGTEILVDQIDAKSNLKITGSVAIPPEKLSSGKLTYTILLDSKDNILEDNEGNNHKAKMGEELNCMAGATGKWKCYYDKGGEDMYFYAKEYIAENCSTYLSKEDAERILCYNSCDDSKGCK